MILSPEATYSICLGKEDYQPHVTCQGGPRRVHSPQLSAAQGCPEGGVLLVCLQQPRYFHTSLMDPFELLVHSGLPDSVTSSKKNFFLQLHSCPLPWTPLLFAAGEAVRIISQPRSPSERERQALS